MMDVRTAIHYVHRMADATTIRMADQARRDQFVNLAQVFEEMRALAMAHPLDHADLRDLLNAAIIVIAVGPGEADSLMQQAST